MKISVVMPCWNGDGPAVLERARGLRGSEHCHEVVIADASGGVSEAAAGKAGAILVRCEVGRGHQLNCGARRCGGDVLLFNHADTLLEPAHLEALADGLGGCIGGAFFKALRSHHPMVGWTDPFVRWWTRTWGILYGDQSVFVRRDVFESMGGFCEIPLMEDVEFSGRLRRAGPVVLLGPPLQTSMRRFRAKGYWSTKLQNIVFVWLFQLKLVPAGTLYHWYYGKRQHRD